MLSWAIIKSTNQSTLYLTSLHSKVTSVRLYAISRTAREASGQKWTGLSFLPFPSHWQICGQALAPRVRQTRSSRARTVNSKLSHTEAGAGGTTPVADAGVPSYGDAARKCTFRNRNKQKQTHWFSAVTCRVHCNILSAPTAGSIQKQKDKLKMNTSWTNWPHLTQCPSSYFIDPHCKHKQQHKRRSKRK